MITRIILSRISMALAIVLAVTLGCGALSLGAQPPVPVMRTAAPTTKDTTAKNTPTGAKEASTKKVTMLGTEVAMHKEDTTDVTTWKDAQIKQEDTTFTAKTIIMRSQGKVHEFTCTGNPVLDDPENHITGDKVLAYSSPRRAEFDGNVKMVCTPKKKDDQKSDLKKKMNEPSTITCDHLSYNYAEKRAQATGNVVIVQKFRTVWADQGTYEQNSELVTFQGNVRMKNTGKEEIKQFEDGDVVTVSLKDDWFDAVAKPGGLVKMEFEVKDDDQPANGDKSAGDKQPPAAKPADVTPENKIPDNNAAANPAPAQDAKPR